MGFEWSQKRLLAIDRVSKVGKSHIFGEEENEWDFSGKCDTSIGRLVGEHDTPN